MYKKIAFILGLVSVSFNLSAGSERLLNKNWEYSEDNFKTYEIVDIPYSWNTFEAVDPVPGYRRDTGWYRKNINLNMKDGKRYFLYFEGSNITTKVYVNSKFAGDHIGGYLGFKIEVTDLLKNGQNLIEIAVDNDYNRAIIPSQKSDFFIYGGITRDLWLVEENEVFIKDFNVTTPKVSEKSALTELEIEIDGDYSKAESIKITIKDRENKPVISRGLEVRDNHFKVKLNSISEPKLWSPDNPYLYKIEVELSNNGNVVDYKSDRIGYRWFEFVKNGPFKLNGEVLKLRGTHRHEEHAGYGPALPNEQHVEDMKLIKNMGVNFVRLGHYPQDPVVYEMCDSLGIIVWDEVPWCRGGIGDEEWKNNTMYMLEKMIDQNYNHPSIVFWSMGNEIYWVPDYEGGGDKEKINEFLTEMHEKSHELDPYRYTSIRKYYAGSHIVDVFSPSIWSGWYAGVYTNYEEVLEKNRKKYDHLLHMEYGGSSVVGRHISNPINGEGVIPADEFTESENQISVRSISSDGDWSESYIVDLFDWHLSVSEKLEWFAGNAQWAIKDFGTPLRPENPLPYINQKGLADRAGNPKDAYYVFKSYWNNSDHFVYIESPTWDFRYGKKDQDQEICVYSNCDEVELFINGKSVGKKSRNYGQFPAHGLQWFEKFKPGGNKLKAVGLKNGEVVSEQEIELDFLGAKPQNAFSVELESEKLENGNILITAIALDWDGNRAANFNGDVFFSKVSGKGELLKNMGTPTGSLVNQFASGKASIVFIPQEGESAVITVMGAGAKGVFIEVGNK